jgi:hypothetical protein
MKNAHRRVKDERPNRRVRVRGVQRSQPDPKRIGEVVVALALAQAEKEAQESRRRRDGRRSP